MKKAPLYSRSRGPARAESPGDSLGLPASPQSSVPTRRTRLRAFTLRHERRLWAAAVLLLISGFGVWHTRTTSGPPALSIKQIEDTIRQSLEEKPLPSPASNAYNAIAPSVVRVTGLMTDGDDGSDMEGDEP